MRCRRASLGLLFALSIPLTAEDARAYEAEVDATTDAQFYTLRSPWGDPVVRRRRYTQTVALHVYDLQGDYVPFGPQLTFKARMRLDSDFGKEGYERNPNQPGTFVPGLEQSPVDVMYAYLEGRNYLGGLVGFRAGRQYVTDSLGWWSFDGGLVRLTTPVFFQVEAYGGFEQRGGLPIMLGTERYSSGGVYRGDRGAGGELELNQYPYFLEESKLAPAYGFAIESSGVQFLHSRLSYRKVINRDRVYTSMFPDAAPGFYRVAGDRVSSERLGYSLRANAAGLGAVRGSVVYDFYNQVVSDRALALDWYTTEELTLGGDYDYYYPTFDGDSIFNWFTHSGMTTLLARTEWRPSRRFDVALSGGVKIFETEGNSGTYGDVEQADQDPDRSETGRLSDGVGNVATRYRWSDGGVGLRGLVEAGARGHRYGGDVTTQKSFAHGYYDTQAIVSVYDWEDGLRPQRSATSLTYVLGGGVTPFTDTRFGVEWEHSMNRLVGQRFRVLATLDFTVLR
ncbi:MAG: hypothetical protein IPI67_05530 [Myxococcales bacterium]|nr:hypothetical protein [Myxococcales bacterium]